MANINCHVILVSGVTTWLPEQQPKEKKLSKQQNHIYHVYNIKGRKC